MLKSPEQKWDFYQTLIDAVPAEAKVKKFFKGRHWIIVQSDCGGTGLAHVLGDFNAGEKFAAKNFTNKKLKDLASLIKSWDFISASAGLAAINAGLTGDFKAENFEGRVTEGNAFEVFLKKAKNKKVAVIGHFPDLERMALEAKELHILERRPQNGDYPDTACEYLLPRAQLVFITGTAIINKSAPRLLELSQKAEVFLVGPSVPLCPALFNYGPKALSGALVPDYDRLAKHLEADQPLEFDKNLVKYVNFFSS
jgi:uncharacterized protein (DUF4213/DUF364 family)